MVQPIFPEWIQDEIGKRVIYRGYSAYPVRWFDCGEAPFVPDTDLNEDGCLRKAEIIDEMKDLEKQRIALHVPLGERNLVYIIAVDSPEYGMIAF